MKIVVFFIGMLLIFSCQYKNYDISKELNSGGELLRKIIIELEYDSAEYGNRELLQNSEHFEYLINQTELVNYSYDSISSKHYFCTRIQMKSIAFFTTASNVEGGSFILRDDGSIHTFRRHIYFETEEYSQDLIDTMFEKMVIDNP